MTNLNTFINTNRGNAGTEKSNTPVRVASDKQKQFYLRLCKTHSVEPMDNLDTVASSVVSSAITKLNNRPAPVSEGQVTAINNMIKDLEDAGIVLDAVKETLPTLTGGSNGTASALITNLTKIRKENTHLLKPTQYQIDTLADWFLCPDVPFEQYNVGKRFHIDKEKGLWRYATTEEFKAILHKALTQEEASRLIGQSQSDVYEWRKNRATDNQKNLINTLELRMANIEVPKEVEYAVVDGVVTQITTSLSRNEYSPEAYVPMTEHQLNQLSFGDAKKYIDMLQWELSNINTVRPVDESVMQFVGDDQNELADKMTNGYAKSNLDIEFDKLESLYHSVKMIAGYEDDEVEHSLTSIAHATKDEDALKEDKLRLREFLMATVISKDGTDEWHKEMTRIFHIVEESESVTAMESLTLEA